MSVSTDAILLYGYCWDDEGEEIPGNEDGAKNRIAASSPCLVGTHCSASCPMAYVAVRASLTISHRGSPREVTSLAVDPAWDDQLAEFCAAMGIKTEGKKTAWWLVSDWGE